MVFQVCQYPFLGQGNSPATGPPSAPCGGREFLAPLRFRHFRRQGHMERVCVFVAEDLLQLADDALAVPIVADGDLPVLRKPTQARIVV